MERRQALKTTASIAGYTFIFGGLTTTIHACKSEPDLDWQPVFFTNSEAKLIVEISERIIPKTDTPGAKDALVDRFIDENIDKNFTIEQQAMFIKALEVFDDKAKSSFKMTFVDLTDEQKDTILEELSLEAKNHEGDTPHIFDVIKEMTVFGFFTSEIGAKECLVYDPIPSEFIGCIDYSEVNGTWAL